MSGNDPKPQAHLAGALLVGVGLAGVVLSAPAPLAVGGAFICAAVALAPVPVLVRGASIGLSASLLAGAALETPPAWLALIVAAVLSEGKHRFGAVAAALGLGAVLLGTVHPGAGIPFFVLAMISAGVSGPQLRWPAALLAIVALLGVGYSWKVQQEAQETSVDGVASLVDSHRADWLEDTVMTRLEDVRLIAPDASAAEKSWALSGRGAPRLALNVLGKTPDVGWQRASLLQQAGLSWAASAHSGASEPDDVVTGPGEIFAVRRLKKNQVLEIPVVLHEPASELVLRANGEFLLGWPELRVQLGAIRQGPIQVPDEGGEWVWKGDLQPGPYVLRVSFENYFDNRHGKRQLTDVVVEVR